MAGKDFSAEARTLERMGLAGMDASQIRRFVEMGVRIDAVQLSLALMHAFPGGFPGPPHPRGKHFTVDIHCHVLTETAEAMFRAAGQVERRPRDVFANPRTREVNRQQSERTRVQFTSVEKRLADMDVMGIDIQALTPAPNQTYYDTPPDLGIATARAINDNIADIVARHPDRFVGLGTVPFQAPELAVTELERLHRSLGLRGIEIATNVAGEDLSAERFRRIFAKAEELGLTIFMHPTGFTAHDSPHFIRPARKRLRTAAAPAACGRSAASADATWPPASSGSDRRACSPDGTTNERGAWPCWS